MTGNERLAAWKSCFVATPPSSTKSNSVGHKAWSAGRAHLPDDLNHDFRLVERDPVPAVGRHHVPAATRESGQRLLLP